MGQDYMYIVVHARHAFALMQTRDSIHPHTFLNKVISVTSFTRYISPQEIVKQEKNSYLCQKIILISAIYKVQSFLGAILTILKNDSYIQGVEKCAQKITDIPFRKCMTSSIGKLVSIISVGQCKGSTADRIKVISLAKYAVYSMKIAFNRIDYPNKPEMTSIVIRKLDRLSAIKVKCTYIATPFGVYTTDFVVSSTRQRY